MVAVEVICVVAASLWIFVVLAALGIGCYFVMKFRKKRRKISRLLDAVRVPIEFGTQGVLLLRRCENAGRTYGAMASDKIGPRLPLLISELLSDRQATPSARSRRR